MAYEYYQTLGVDRSASADEIKKAYRKRAMELHPDRHAGDKAKEAEFKKVNEAYSVLSDPQKKAAYDRFGTSEGFSGGPGMGGFGVDFDLSDVFESFFGGGFAGGGRARKHVGEDIEVVVSLSFSEALLGCRKTVTFEKQSGCTECHGSGGKPGTSPENCPVCHGSGKVRRRVDTFFGTVEQSGVCPECEGRGKVFKEKCATCRGAGTVRTKVEREIDVPAGIDDGMSIKLRGEGNEGKDGNGDLYVTFRVPESSEGLVRDGENLTYTLAIDPAEAVLGAKKKVKIPVIGDRTVDIKAGTQHGEVIRFKGDGVRHLSRDLKGDLFVVLHIRIPTHPTKREKELYAEIAKERKLEVDGKGVLGKIFGE